MQDETKVPRKLMFILCTVILSEPISLTILFPFVYFMVLDFGIPPENVGYYVGLLASSFSFAQLLTSYFWGWLSDKIGRRPVLLCGLVGTCLSTLMFGLSKSLFWAVSSRIACGFLNGNVGVAKCVLGEITNNKNRGAAFALLGLNYGIGMIIGPSLGGLLSWPTKNYPWLFGGNYFLTKYPYFLPCACSSIVGVFGFVSGYIFLPETARHLISTPVPEEVVVEDECLQRIESMTDIESNIECYSNPNLLQSREETVAELNFNADETTPLIQVSNIERSCCKLGFNQIASAAAYALLAFEDIFFAETFPLWAVALPPVGLGWDSKNIGICLSIIGFVSLICQTLIYPSISRMYPPLTLFKAPMYAMIGFFFVLPLISRIAATEFNYFVWPLILLAMAVKTVLGNFLFTSVMVLITNSSSSGNLGKVNGVSQAGAALARTIGPAFGGSIWAWSCSSNLAFPLNDLLIFEIGVFLVLLMIIQSRMLSTSLNEGMY